ncbi:MAG TPA: hypothetical protein VKK79_22540 [Candidatus Lokiarchaeia archaeon]|nr:hypothetical protein [Candidatus Lokiarchaeia archaeon]
MDQDIPVLLDAVLKVSQEIAKVESVEMIALIGSLARNAKKLMSPGDLAVLMSARTGDCGLQGNRDRAPEMDEGESPRGRKSRDKHAKQMKDVDLAIPRASNMKATAVTETSTTIHPYGNLNRNGTPPIPFSLFRLSREQGGYSPVLVRAMGACAAWT